MNTAPVYDLPLRLNNLKPAPFRLNTAYFSKVEKILRNNLNSDEGIVERRALSCARKIVFWRRIQKLTSCGLIRPDDKGYV